jgi:hypothetical protein
MRIPYGRVQGSGYNPCTGKYCIICPGGTKKKKTLFSSAGWVGMNQTAAETMRKFIGKK